VPRCSKVEHKGPPLDLTGRTVVGCNGSGGRAYKTIQLSGTIPSRPQGFGVLAFDFSGLQNGSPDGLALVDSGGNVVEFISYEGHFTAGDGTAAGMVSAGISASETSSTPTGQSLQLTGRGTRRADFVWTRPAPVTRGEFNTTQEFVSPR
jgi:hypothetical protein